MMPRCFLKIAGLVLTVGMVSGLASAPSQQKPAAKSSPAYRPAISAGPHVVERWQGEWRDPSRSRTIPVRIYFPKSSDGTFPVIIMSHGLGGSREGYEFVGERWASRGYISVHIQHPGSDTSILAGPQPLESMKRAAADPANALNRPRDVSFSLDMLQKLNSQEGFPLAHRMDLARTGVAGHSFGAYTALASAGWTVTTPAGRTVDLHDSRIKACIAMSPPSKSKAESCPAYSKFNVPCLHMTGTKDWSLIGDTTPELRRVPYECIAAPDQYLITFAGGDHMVFTGRVRAISLESDTHIRDWILESTTAFWDAYLQGDTAARKWLAQGGFQSELGKGGTLEQKASATRSK